MTAAELPQDWSSNWLDPRELRCPRSGGQLVAVRTKLEQRRMVRLEIALRISELRASVRVDYERTDATANSFNSNCLLAERVGFGPFDLANSLGI